MKSVMIIGSAADAISACSFNLDRFEATVVLNNAWQIRQDWTHSIFPEDFPEARRPKPKSGQHLVTHEQYVPANNAFGGIVYAGATMAFTAAYWVMHDLRPDLITFCGCDMVYDSPSGKTHFYGNGDADPLRSDPTLQSLTAKSNRMMLLAAKNECAMVNVSDLPNTRLTLPRISASTLDQVDETDRQKTLSVIAETTSDHLMRDAMDLEANAGIFFESGDYWKADEPLNQEGLREIDTIWEKAVGNLSDTMIDKKPD